MGKFIIVTTRAPGGSKKIFSIYVSIRPTAYDGAKSARHPVISPFPQQTRPSHHLCDRLIHRPGPIVSVDPNRLHRSAPDIPTRAYYICSSIAESPERTGRRIK